ncbi:MAG TPA: ABC transporter permease [Vicinamibacterales bacterium]|nr:ABC transporter permease [Vicinamibacterales bacterium]
MLDSIAHDLKYAVRSLTRTPSFTTAAVLTLGLGIGANTAMFSFADATALRPPDVPRASEIVRVFTSSRDVPYGEVSYRDYLDMRSETKTLTGLVAYETGDFALAANPREPAKYLGGWLVSANFFSVLGVEPAMGRGFVPQEDTIASSVAVISHRVWERDFQESPTVIGRQILLSGAPFTIVGVAPERFGGTELYFHPDIFIPLSAIRSVYPALGADVLTDRTQRMLTVLGRLPSDVRLTQAADEFATLAANMERVYPDSNRGRTAVVLPEIGARARLDSGGTEGAIVILGLVGLVLLLACANVANLALSRSSARSRDLALRASLGATRGHIFRQLLTESTLLAIAGGAAGIIIAGWVLAYLSQVLVIPSALPLWIDLRLDSRVLFFTAFTTILSAILSGLVPALRTSSTAGLNAVLKQKPDLLGRTPSLSNGLVVTQVAISVLVLVCAGLMVRASFAAQRVDPGFRSDRVLLASFNPRLVQLEPDQMRTFYARLVEQMREQPGVSAVGLTRYVPLGVTSGSLGIAIDGASLPDGQDRISVAETVVDSGYWDVMRIPVVRGRSFRESDTSASPRVAIVNETLASRYWANENPIGKVVRVPDSPGPNGPETLTLEVVGVAKDGKYWQLGESPQPFIYRPFSQARPGPMTMVVLAADDASPIALTASVRTAAASVNSTVPLYDLRTMEDLYRSRALLPSRMVSQIVTALGVLGLVLACVGLYAVVSFLFSNRIQEIGIRMAVGASPPLVLGMVIRHAMFLIAPGLALGLGVAVVLTPMLASPAFDFVTPGDPLVLTLAPVTMAAVCLIAALVPARRAAHVDPTRALRHD